MKNKYTASLVLGALLACTSTAATAAGGDKPTLRPKSKSRTQPARKPLKTLEGQAVSGTVLTDIGDPLPGATIFVKGTFVGTSTNSEGHFKLDLDFAQGPVTLVVSFIGYENVELPVSEPNQALSISLTPSIIQLNETVVSASRVEESIMRAPITIEKISSRQIEQISTPEVLAGLGQFKGVDVNSASMLFTSISTRGFNTAKSERVVQLYDYTDAQLPSLSLSPGNLLGIPELDMESIEVVHGPASALYGSNALNGVVLFNSKDPFVYEGLTARVRGGQRNFLDAQVRYAHKLGQKWAFKVNGSYIRALDWLAENYEASATSRAINPEGSPLGTSAVNGYGDSGRQLRRNERLADGSPVNAELAGKTVYLPRFTEAELIANDNYTNAYRLQGSLSYLITKDLKATLDVKRAEGTSTYQNQSRIRMKGLGTNQYRAELKSSRGFLRAYTTEDFTGESYELNSLGNNLQLSPVAEGSAITYADRFYSTFNAEYTRQRNNGVGQDQALAAARQVADATRLSTADPRFGLLRERIIQEADALRRGSKLLLNSFLSDVSGQYTFQLGQATDLVVGGAYRDFRIGSGGGFVLTDRPDRRLHNYEYGGYLQASYRLLDDRLKLAAAGRVDHFRNFEAAFSPRVSAVVSLGQTKQHNLRASYGRAFRAPSQIEQYSRVDVGNVLGLGNIGAGFQGYSLVNAQGQSYQQVLQGVPLASFEFSAPSLELEQVNTYEIGYKGIIGKNLYVDVNCFDSRYNNFIGAVNFIGNPDGTRPTMSQLLASQPDFGPGKPSRIIFAPFNNTQQVHTQGVAAGLNYYWLKAVHLSANYSFNYLNRKELPENFRTFFNTPEQKYNVGVSGSALRHLSYNVNYRWAEGHFQEMPFASGRVADYSSVDVYVGYTVPKLFSTFQVGASNLLDSRNIQVYGGPNLGRLVYAGWLVEFN
ncbi:TonB-dependent receptor [Hymenobacter weizhouensis]|uniref:TonB-dependent receptor n=1 Tax=Hymenobacter sp. YIM 151500-1 TaxID=2987689 RepID=UPI0022260F5D|nr:TonB-dependent receptor [Hymenobacter sp. YIM 151500-1]UYZ62381.1 TonB-dependent receptor [Hymenobacter sp. YIM 151500-1]